MCCFQETFKYWGISYLTMNKEVICWAAMFLLISPAIFAADECRDTNPGSLHDDTPILENLDTIYNLIEDLVELDSKYSWSSQYNECAEEDIDLESLDEKAEDWCELIKDNPLENQELIMSKHSEIVSAIPCADVISICVSEGNSEVIEKRESIIEELGDFPILFDELIEERSIEEECKNGTRIVDGAMCVLCENGMWMKKSCCPVGWEIYLSECPKGQELDTNKSEFGMFCFRCKAKDISETDEEIVEELTEHDLEKVSEGAKVVTIEQIDIDLSGMRIINSNVGRLTVSPEYKGYLNMYTDVGWVIRNLYLDNSITTTYFDLGNKIPLDIKTLSAYININNEPQPVFLDGPRAIHAVGTKTWNAEGIIIPDELNNKPIIVPGPPATNGWDMFVETLPLTLPKNYTYLLPNVSNKEAAYRQCVPMSVANSLQYLEDAENINVPDEHNMGLKGNDSLVGKLDEEMKRNVISRRNGTGVWFDNMLKGKFSYLNKSGLSGKLINKHQGRGYGKPLPNGNFTSNGITSRDDGDKVTFEWLCQQIKEGEDVEIIFSYENASGDIVGGHAVRVFECGETLGEPWIGFAHDRDQSDDRDGLETPREKVIDSDGDGLLNIFGSNSEIVFAVSESAIPPQKGIFKRAWEWLKGLFS